MNQEDNQNQPNLLFKAAFKDLQSFFTVSYLLLIVSGMIFTNMKYQQFGINIFQYADIFDFLIAPFRDYRIVLFAIPAIAIPSLVIYGDKLGTKHPKRFGMFRMKWSRKHPMDNTAKNVTFFLFYVIYIFSAAVFYGRKAEEHLKKEPPVTIIFEDDSREKGILIGKTKEVLFLLKEEKVKVIPFTSLVKEMQLE